MEDLKNRILYELEISSYAPYTFDELKQILNCDSDSLYNALEELKEAFLIHETKKKRYGLLKTFGMYKGIIEVKDQGYGFIYTPDFEHSFFVPKCNINGALNKDEVIFRITNINDVESDEAEVVKVSKRSMQFTIGTIQIKYYKKVFIPIDKSIKMHFEISDFGLSVEDDVVKVQIDEYLKSSIKGHIVEILGNTNDVGMDIKAIAAKYDFYQDFNEQVINNLQDIVEQYNDHLFRQELKRREKINRKIITIDGKDAKDLDDAVSVQKLQSGNYELGVYIADVSFFVTEGSALDKEAYNRGTSVYLIDRVIPMLPHKLSNDLCSLNEKTPKLVIACIMEINSDGDVVDFEIKEAIIETLHRMNYDDVNKIINEDKELSKQYQDIVYEINIMNELAYVLRTMREKRGSLNFDVPEAKIIVDDDGIPIDVQIRKRYDAEKLIEEFMLIANETVASCINKLELPFIYRIHDEPNQDKLLNFKNILKNSIYNLSIKKNSKITPKVLQKLLNEINGKDNALSMMLLRMMAKARYDVDNIGHYGLASKCYTHFTSPIRRYPDLIVHRLLRQYLFKGQVSVEEQNINLNKLTDIALQASQKERDAISCEYEVEDMKKAEYMQYHLHEKYEGIISGVTKFGLFVTLPNTIEGLVRIGSIKDDYYTFEPNLMALVGKSTKRIFRLGDKVKVIVDSASKSNNEINFIIPLKNNNNMIKYSKGMHNEKRRNKRNRKK